MFVLTWALFYLALCKYITLEWILKKRELFHKPLTLPVFPQVNIVFSKYILYAK